MKNALNALSAKRMKMQNPLLRRMQGASDEMRKNMMKSYEGERERMLAMQREELYGMEDENLLYAGERKRAELAQRTEIGKTADYLIKRGYPRNQAQALAMAFGKEMAGLKEELSSQVGDSKAKLILKEMREQLLEIFKNSNNMGQLIREIKSHGNEFSQSVLAQVRNEVFQKYGLPTE